MEKLQQIDFYFFKVLKILYHEFESQNDYSLAFKSKSYTSLRVQF